MSTSGIDTTSLLTILGVVAAVWAIVPPTARLSFRLSLSWWAWLIVLGVILTVHVFVFEDVLRALHLYPVLGPWTWGFDKNGVLYLLFLGLTFYVYLRSRRTHLHRSNLELFDRLAMSLLHARKFEELGVLLAQHLEAAFRIANGSGVRSCLESWLRPPTPPMPNFSVINGKLVADPSRPTLWFIDLWHKVRTWLAEALAPSNEPLLRARMLIRALLSSRQLVGYLALAHPYLCLAVMDRAGDLVDDFQDNFFEAMLGNESSVFYAELKNNHNLAGGHRLRIPPENRLVAFYLKDVNVAAQLGVYRSLGEAMLSLIDADDELTKSLNGPMRTYGEVEAYRCPIFCGIHFFRIMVLEGLHQQTVDHLWLHYVPHFVDHILARARPLEPEDENDEFPTRFCYLLYQLVNVTTDWIEEAAQVTEDGDQLEEEKTEGRHAYISFQASEALGPVMQSILRSEKLSERLKDELLETMLMSLKRVEAIPRLAPLARAVAKSVVRPHGFEARGGYIVDLSNRYDQQDHVLRSESTLLKQAIDAEMKA